MSAPLPVPLSLKIVSWIGLFSAASGVCALPFSARSLVREDPAVAIFGEHEWYFPLMVFQLVFGVLVLGLGIAGFIGALRARPSSRPLLYAWMGASVLQVCIGVGVSYTMVAPILSGMLDSGEPAMKAVALCGLGGSSLLGFGCGLIVPLVTLFILSQQPVRDAYASWSSEA